MDEIVIYTKNRKYRYMIMLTKQQCVLQDRKTGNHIFVLHHIPDLNPQNLEEKIKKYIIFS
jgi:hypothetical protein